MIVADTHVILWLAFAPDKISRRAAVSIREARRGGGLAVSAISLFELAMLSRKGRIHLTISLESFLAETESRFSVLPITGQICARAVELPVSFPKDPADRIIAATSLIHGLPLVTADSAIRGSKLLRTIW